MLEALAPPWVKLFIKKFDGSKIGDHVILEVIFLGLISQHWENRVINSFESNEECFFIDEGVVMPFPIVFWKHTHRISGSGDKSLISDEIEFRCRSKLIAFIFYPILWIQFFWRKPVYRRYFGNRRP